MKKVVIIIILSIVLLLSLLAVFLLNPITGTKAGLFETTPPSYSIRFEVEGQLLAEQTVDEQALPQPVGQHLLGIRIVGWTDMQGQPADPFATPVTGDACYQAVIHPELSNHAPYLFVSDAGLLLPDEVLTHAALTQALHALAASGAKDYFPTLSTEDTPVTHTELTQILGRFFEEEAVASAFPEAQDPSRSVFAAGMQQLLGRSATEALTLSENHTIPEDITSTREDAAVLLEASVAHTHDSQDITWSELDLPMPYDPGFINIEGQLYYVQEDRHLLRDGNVGTLYFDADGRYTSGDATLDEIVVNTLKDMAAQNPDADRFALLRVVYDYCHQNFTYRRTFDHPEYGSTGWEIQRALAMFETTKGNCYSYSAIFWALSRGLGYETRAISGKVLDDEQPHSWCIIQLDDGEDYFFDPQWQYNYTERNIFHYDMFQIPMDKIGFWQYQWVEE